MKKIKALLVSILAVVFVISASYLVYSNIEKPMSQLSNIEASFFDKPSPANWIKENQIQIYRDRIVILIPNATLSRYAATKSMDPSIDSYANGVEITPESPEQLHVGDIIAYQVDDSFIVHRIIEIGSDDKGWYCIPKGDNAVQNDGKIRFEQIKYVTIAIIY